MAIAFARLQYVQRSKGQNICCKSAYNARIKIFSKINNKTYNFSKRKDQVFHEILLPKTANNKFKEATILWNEAELKEKRINSQTGKEMVLALPDDPEITLKDKIKMVKSFINNQFVSKGLAAQIDIHKPHLKEGNNWHAHILLTTRRFKENGEDLGEKARDLDLEILKGYTVEKNNLGGTWQDCQNNYFKENGINLQVDATGIVGQKHVGPVRMRGNFKRFTKEQEDAKIRNKQLYEKPEEIIEKITKYNSTFTQKDIDRYIKRYIEPAKFQEVKSKFWEMKNLVELNQNHNTQAEKVYTTLEILAEEDKMMRLSDRLIKQTNFKISDSYKQVIEKKGLNKDQAKAAQEVCEGKKITLIEGKAGVGKSHLLSTIYEIFESNNLETIGMSPTSKAVDIMKNEGISNSKTLHEVLYSYYNNKNTLSQFKVAIIDEAGMVDNQTMQVFLQIAWKENLKVIMVGDFNQLPPVGRGGAFKAMCKRHGSSKLKEIVRQKDNEQKRLAYNIAEGKVVETIDMLDQKKLIHWGKNEEETISLLMGHWKADRIANPKDNLLIVEQRNDYIHVLNKIAQNIRLKAGELKGIGYECEHLQGRGLVYQGDKIQFRRNNKALGIINGKYGTCTSVNQDQITVKTDDNKEISFNPQEFCWYQLGYAGTIYQAQGATVDRTYVLHNSNMNMNAFYVSMTRHKKDVRYFVSKEETKTLYELKKHLTRDVSKETSQDYELKNKSNNKKGVFSNLIKNTKNYLDDRFLENQDFYSYKKEDLFERYEVKKIELEEDKINKFKNIKEFNFTKVLNDLSLSKDEVLMKNIESRLNDNTKIKQEFIKIKASESKKPNNSLDEQFKRYEAKNGFKPLEDHAIRIKECIKNSVDLKDLVQSKQLKPEIEKLVYENMLEDRCSLAIWNQNFKSEIKLREEVKSLEKQVNTIQKQNEPEKILHKTKNNEMEI